MRAILCILIFASALAAQSVPCGNMARNPRTGLPDCVGQGGAGGTLSGVATLAGDNTLTGRQDAKGASSTAPVKTGTSLPVTCATGDQYFKTDETPGQELYTCNGGIWTQASTAAGAAGGSVFAGSRGVALAYASSLTFNLADVSDKSPVRFDVGVLTGDVTTIAFSSVTAGAKFSIHWTQGNPPHTVDFGSSVVGGCPITELGNAEIVQELEVAEDGATINNVKCSILTQQGVVAYGKTAGACFTAPYAPPLGEICMWLDAAHDTVLAMNHGGTVFTMVETATGVTTNEFVTYIGVDGVHTARPTAAQVLNALDLTGANTMTNVAEPSTPAGGKVALWTDSTHKVFYVKGDGGVKTHTVATTDCSSIGHVAKINSNGTVDCTSDAGATSINVAGKAVVPVFGWCDYCLSQAGMADNAGLVWQFTPTSNITVTKIGVLNGAGSSGYTSAAIYADSFGACDALIVQSTPQHITTPGEKVYFPVSATPLLAGNTYWFALTTDTFSGGTYYGQGTGILAATLMNEVTHARAGSVTGISTGTGGSLSFGSSCGSVAAGGVATLPYALLIP